MLAMFRWLHFHYFRPFWPCSGSCIFIIFSHFGHIQTGAFFIIVGNFGHVQAAAVLSLLAVLAMFKRLRLYYFRPCWPRSGGCICIILARFGHVQAAAF